MMRLPSLFLGCVATVGLLAPIARCADPTFSMEVVAVNSQEISGGPTAVVRAVPGDLLTVKVFLRNWSPNDEDLNAYQFQIEPMDFTSGSSGNIRPVNYTEAREKSEMNLANANIDQSDPEWLFAGKQTVSIVDTRSEGYRWMSVLADTSDANIHPQDNGKFYAGTINMKVSNGARGRFMLGYIENPASSLLLDTRGVLISTIQFELLTVIVSPDVLGVIAQLSGVEEFSPERSDINGDGKLATDDLVQAINLLNENTAPGMQTSAGTE